MTMLVVTGGQPIVDDISRQAPSCGAWLAWVNHVIHEIANLAPDAAQTGGIRSLQMSVAMTTREMCVAAKGEINLENRPEEGANSPREINLYTVFTHPDPQADPTPRVGGAGQPTLALVRDGLSVTISWGAAGFVLETAPAVTGPGRQSPRPA